MLFKPPLQVCNFSIRRFRVFLLHCCRNYGGGLLLVVFIVFIITFVLNCDAKVQTYLQPTKHLAKKVCIFNLLQQISMFLPKFIHILSTKTGKCAIYKANIFAFAEYPHTYTHVHYIKTNNNAIFVAVRSVVL